MREKSEIDKISSLEDSVNIPYSELQNFLVSEKKDLSTNSLIFYCAVGERSALAVQLCQSYNLKNVFHLIGGINGINQ